MNQEDWCDLQFSIKHGDVKNNKSQLLNVVITIYAEMMRLQE